MYSFKKSSLIIVSLLLLTGCARDKNISPSSEFMSRPDTIVIAQVSGIEKASYYKTGGQGLLDQAINSAVCSEMQTKIQEIPSAPILENKYYGNFGDAFKNKGFEVKVEEYPISRETLREPQNNDEKYAPYDFSYLKDDYDVNYAIILDAGSFGVARNYYGFIPLGAPIGTAHLNVYLVDLTDNSIVGESHYTAAEIIAGDWDVSPDYPAVMKAARRSLEKALDESYIVFFGKEPK
jgi:hypothetical protein